MVIAQKEPKERAVPRVISQAVQNLASGSRELIQILQRMGELGVERDMEVLSSTISALELAHGLIEHNLIRLEAQGLDNPRVRVPIVEYGSWDERQSVYSMAGPFSSPRDGRRALLEVAQQLVEHRYETMDLPASQHDVQRALGILARLDRIGPSFTREEYREAIETPRTMARLYRRPR